MRRAWTWFGNLKPARQALVVTGLLVVLIAIIAAVSAGSNKSNSQAGGATPPPPPPATTQAAPPSGTKASGPEKASNGDDAKDLHNRAQQAVNEAEACLTAVYIAAKTKDVNGMASNLAEARGICNKARDYLVSNNHHGFTDQNDELFAVADYAKSATNAGLAYLDTQAPSKLADFTEHVRDANGAYTQGLHDLNARLSDLGVAHVKG
jgi:hypothetical protein